MNKILLVGFVCVSLGAFAQSSANQGQAPNAKTASTKTAAAPPDASSQTAGKRMHKPIEMQQEAGAGGQATAKTSGGKTVNDDWTTSAAAKTNGSNNGQAATHVATGDVNGDSTPDLTATKSSGSATTKDAAAASNSSANSPKDAASGQTSGKRQHEPVTVKKEVDAATPKLKSK